MENISTHASVSLSYVITTRNKLSSLREVMRHLLENVQEDEEIVVVDGVSTDGTIDFLKSLYEQGKIHQLISEPDRGEAHGYNKGLLLAQGDLIKFITDDDVFYYPAIQECKEFMLEHTSIDVLAGNVANLEIESIQSFCIIDEWERNFDHWLENKKVFSFSGLGLMIRRSSLSLIGLFSTGIVLVDHEYSKRITYLDLNLAWNPRLVATRIGNPRSNYRKFKALDLQEERERCLAFYDYKEYLRRQKEKSLKVFLIRKMLFIKKELTKISKIFFNQKLIMNSVEVNFEMINYGDIFNLCQQSMKDFNDARLSKNNPIKFRR